VNEISLAFNPANRKQFIMRKDMEVTMFDKIIEMLKDGDIKFKEEELQKFFKEVKLSDEGQGAVLAIAKIVKSTDEHISDDFFGKLVKAVPEFTKLAQIVEIKSEPNKEALEQLVKDITKEVEEELRKESDMGDDVIKLMKDEITELKKDRDQGVKDLETEKDIRIKTEIKALVKDGNFPGDFDDTVELLAELKKTSESVYDKTVTAFEKSAKIMEAAGLFKETGAVGDGNPADTAYDELMVKVETYMKENDKATVPEAMKAVARANKDLYREQFKGGKK